MDNTDYKILNILRQDGRITMKALAEQINMSIPAAAERVRRLEDQNAILGYQAVLGSKALGRQVDAVILAAARPGMEQALRELVQERPEVIEAWDLAGRIGLMLRVSCTDMPAFQALVSELQERSTTESYLYLNQLKKTGIPLPVQG